MNSSGNLHQSLSREELESLEKMEASQIRQIEKTINEGLKRKLSDEKFKTRGEMLYQKAQLTEQKKEYMRNVMQQSKENQEFRKCTFSPTTGRGPINFQEFNQRNQQWYEDKQSKIEKMKIVSKDKGIEECTFKPKTNSGHKSAAMKSSTNLNGSSYSSKKKGSTSHLISPVKTPSKKAGKDYL